jgi:hypothetical protein
VAACYIIPRWNHLFSTDYHGKKYMQVSFTVMCCVDVLQSFWGTFAKLLKATVNFVMSVRLSVHTERFGLPLDKYSLNLIFECFSKFCRENSSFIKI